jgi:hypothetical protein
MHTLLVMEESSKSWVLQLIHSMDEVCHIPPYINIQGYSAIRILEANDD